MSYNTRRSNTGFDNRPQHQTPSAAAVGQRRPVVTNNFVPGGQLAGQQQQKATPPPQRAPQAQQAANFRNQGTPQQAFPSQNYSTTPQQQARYQQAKPVQQAPVTPSQPQQQQPPPQPQQQAKTVPILPGTNPPPPDHSEDSMETNEDGTKKRPWFKNRGKVTKAEKVRRRNMRLSKILQPKNAVMILNELIKGCQYTVDELPCKVDANQFRATVNFEGQEFAGAGRTKIAAKNSAAETALKYLVKNKQLKLKKEDDSEGDEKMEIPEEDGSHVMPWSQIASFAMYKLFSNWGEDPSIVTKPESANVPKAAGSVAAPAELRPAKKMPDNPESVNPLMLMNQMLPGAQWNEVGKSGTPPNVVFTFSVTVDGKTFSGTGASKKAAKKLAAFAACHDILKVSYPADVWVPLY